MANVLDDVATRIATAVSGTVGTDVFKSTMPPLPDAVIVCYETGGLAPEKRFGTKGIEWERPGIQVVARGAAGDYATPRATIQTVFESLSEVEAEDLSSTRYYLSEPLQNPFALDVDEQDRPSIAFNILFTKQE